MKKVVLAIMDGVGISEEKEGNAVVQSKPKFLKKCFKDFPNTSLNASEEFVGLPTGQMGNSEVGHTNLGAGRIVPQTLIKINNLIQNGEFFENLKLIQAFKEIENNQTTLHLLGLLSDGGIHSHMNHIFALIELSKKFNIKKIALHLFLDGRDTGPTEGKRYLDILQSKIKDLQNVEIASICGRYFAMDREEHYERTQLAYDTIAKAKGQRFNSYNDFYSSTDKTISDEFVHPFVANQNYNGINDGDTLIFCNFRADRMRQICYSFADEQLEKIERIDLKNLKIYTLTEYSDKMFNLGVQTIIEDKPLKNTLTEVVSQNGYNILKIAESTKYAHVTYFFNGGEEKPFEHEDRILIPSDNISTYDLKPKMKAKEISNACVKNIKTNHYELIVLNFANGDMVGHSANMKATIKAIKAVDKALKKIYRACEKNGYTLLITADHGNAEKLLDKNKSKWTAHTLNKVPFILCGDCKLKQGENWSLANVAPTVLDLLEISKPSEMTEKSLLN